MINRKIVGGVIAIVMVVAVIAVWFLTQGGAPEGEGIQSKVELEATPNPSYIGDTVTVKVNVTNGESGPMSVYKINPVVHDADNGQFIDNVTYYAENTYQEDDGTWVGFLTSTIPAGETKTIFQNVSTQVEALSWRFDLVCYPIFEYMYIEEPKYRELNTSYVVTVLP